jgi:hypothetical protein
LYRSKQAVKHQLRAAGEKISHYSACEIAILAEAEFERNREQLINEAAQSVATWPEFARWQS